MDKNDIEKFSDGMQRQIIDKNIELEDDVIDYFLRLMVIRSNYRPFYTHEMQQLNIFKIPRRCPNNPSDVGHFVTAYYDTKRRQTYFIS